MDQDFINYKMKSSEPPEKPNHILRYGGHKKALKTSVSLLDQLLSFNHQFVFFFKKKL